VIILVWGVFGQVDGLADLQVDVLGNVGLSQVKVEILAEDA
jgi:hypothetical protein